MLEQTIDLHAQLKQYFGYDEFRPHQEEVIRSVLAGRDTLVLMPTGGGKSLCYQLPSLCHGGLTLVISPLVALMKDQVDALRRQGIAAAAVSSMQSPEENRAMLEQAKAGKLRLLYLAPERLSTPAFVRFLQTLTVRLIAIDEAHCISEWGHDFRPEYRQLDALRSFFPSVPVIALTATATGQVMSDIQKQLQLREPGVFVSSFNRPNLSYVVLPKQKTFARLVTYLRAYDKQSVIIYCFSRKGTEKLAAQLTAEGIRAIPYHAGLPAETRSETQERFLGGRVPVVVATIAFGMGINKPDIRLVVHYDLPKSVEGYYQETGRAGRDGKPSECILFYSTADVAKHRYFIRRMGEAEQLLAEKKLREMVTYAETKSCKRQNLLAYFGEPSAPQCQTCISCQPRLAKVEAPSAGSEYDTDLFEQLRQLRKKIADELSVPAFHVFSDRSLRQMSSQYPQSEHSFLQVIGVGPTKLRQFGQRFLQLIGDYARPRSLKEGVSDSVQNDTGSSRPAKHLLQGKTSTYQETKRLMEEKLSLQEAARRKECKPSTVIQHLEYLQQAGEALDLSHLRPGPMQLERIKVAFAASGGTALKPVYLALNEEVPYDELRLARLFLDQPKS